MKDTEMIITAVDQKPCFLTYDHLFYMDMLKRFVGLMEETRKAQKDYFKTRNPAYLAAARKLESLVDTEIECYKNTL